MTPSSEPDPTSADASGPDSDLDCVSCGACCFSIGPAYIQLSGDDHARLTEEEQAQLTRWMGNRVYMRMDEGHCNALRVDANGGFPCSIYERRPQTCRELPQGGEACLNDRDRVLRGSGTCARRRAELLEGLARES